MTDAYADVPGTQPVTIFHNPECSKSRGALEMLNERSVDYRVVDYLVSPPSKETLAMIASTLVDPVPELIRTTDERFIELGVDPDTYRSAEEVIAFLFAHPDLMQRPVVVAGDRAVIARPTERLAELLDGI
ncbi:MAG: arsenate reductase (glutaredoxin) [Acidimicrobiales bacterium]|nr:arsenate reductase (glutaredoxin) [Acidimicrobiales bacterium]